MQHLFSTVYWLAFLLSPFVSWAETYYVSHSGKDGNTGTSPALAWATIDKLNTTYFQPGDTILLEGGSLFEGGILVKPNRGGTAQEPIVFSSYGLGRATISSGKVAGFKAYNTAGIRIENLIFAGAGRNINVSFGVEFYMDIADTLLSFIRIDQVEVYGYREAGIAIISWDQTTGGFKDVSITNSSSHDNGDAGIAIYAQGIICHKNVYVAYSKAYDNPGIPDKDWNHSGSGIMVGGADGAVIEYCEAYNNGWLNSYGRAGPIGIWGYHCRNLLIQYNESYGNRTKNRTDGGGFDIDGGCTSCIIQYNYSHDNDGAGYVISQYRNAPPMRDVVVRYNISENDARKNSFGSILVWSHGSSGAMTGTDIYNNTIYTSPSAKGSPAGVWVDVNSTYEVNFRNNILLTSGNVPLVDGKRSQNVRFEGNNYWSADGDFKILWHGVTYTSLQDWRTATGQEASVDELLGTAIDPQLRGPGTGITIGSPTELYKLSGYELKETSPLVLNGLDLKKRYGIDVGKSDFFGNILENPNGFSVGAYQFIKQATPFVLITSFTATNQGQSALLQWETSAERRSRGFGVEVSVDGTTYKPLGFVPSNTPNTDQPQSYTYVDAESDKSGTCYYRLRQVNLDGTATYSEVKELHFEREAGVGILAYPNPFSNVIILDVMAEEEEKLMLSLKDISGRTILIEASQLLQIGNNTLRLNLPQKYPAGIYLLTVQQGDKLHIFKLLSQ